MKRLGWMAGAKALAATTALACVTLVGSTGAQADTYSYSYQDNFGAAFNGSFQATITGIGSNISTSGPVSINNANGSFDTYFSGSITSFNGSLSLNNGLGTFSGSGTDSKVGLFEVRANGQVSGSSTSFSFGSALSGLFSAMNTTPSSGGGGGGGGGGSGGAPTPEVNAGLGILIAGASFAFLRRKRGGRHEMAAA